MSKKFMKDICRTIGCNDKRFCNRCNELNKDHWNQLVSDHRAHSDSLNKAGVSVEPFDAIDRIEVVMSIEEDYNIEFRDDEFEGFATYNQFRELLQNKLREIANV